MQEFNLAQDVTQRQILTQETKLFVELLQQPSYEVLQSIKEEIRENPFLEGDIEAGNINPIGDIDIAEDIEDLGKLPSYENLFNNEEYDKKKEFAKSSIVETESLYDFLIKQVRLLNLDDEEYRIAEVLISLLDKDGYLRKTIKTEKGIEKIPFTDEELSGMLGVSKKMVRNVLEKLWGLEPYGVFARDIRECFLIQIRNYKALQVKEQEILDIAERIIKEAFPHLLKIEVEKIAKKLKTKEDKIKEAIKYISTLEPFPGRKFDTEKPRYIIPDVIVKEDTKGEFIIIFNKEWLPSVKINKEYKMLFSKLKSIEDRKFMREKYKKALMFVKALEMRKNTILKVVSAIVEYQKDFFRKGIKYLKPLTLDMIANEVGINKSTVSRVSNGKFLECKWGIFEIKFFFTGGYQTTTNKNISTSTVKEYIKMLIDNENPEKPLRDSEIAKIIKEQKGINIARRTVAKYREDLNIPPYNKRKRMKTL